MSDRGEYRPIPVVLLDGPDFQALPTPEARWVFVACKLKCGPCGIAVIPGLEAAVAEWTGYDVATVARALAVLEHGATPWIRRERNVLWIVGGLAHEPSRNVRDKNHRASVVSYLAGLPHLPLVKRFIAEHAAWLDDNTQPGKDLGWVREESPRTPAGPPEDPPRTPRSTETEDGDGIRKRNVRGRRRADAGSATPTTTWLSGAATAWQAKFGAASAFPWGKAGKLLAPLKDRPPEEITDHLARYLEGTDARFVNLARFAETYGAWGEDEKLTDELGNPTAAYFRAFGGGPQ